MRERAPEAWIRSLIAAEPYWFHRIDLGDGLVTPGWSDPVKEKLPYYGLPADMRGMRVLDVGAAEGFFSFEAERRGAAEVVSVDVFPDSVRRFGICRAALGSSCEISQRSVYDLDPRTSGTFDLVMFFGVLYHLRHPLLALERVRSVCSGLMLMQTAGIEDIPEAPARAVFRKRGVPSGPKGELWDPTVFWLPNAACAADMVEAAGFVAVELAPQARAGIVLSASVPQPTPGRAPDQETAPWS